jgi:UDP-N-acetylglucosamine 2-epimerase (non-hydrolysing)
VKIDLIAGARPNFMKVAPIINAIEALETKEMSYRLVHTGQHYDYGLSGSFFNELGIPVPHINFNVRSGSQATQTAKIMARYKELLEHQLCDLCLVVGDVNSSMACAITAKKAGTTVAHVEAGIRSHDHTMPEEINRIVTDSISDHFFTTSTSANENLKREGHQEHKIHYVGNIMIDSLLKHMPRFHKPSFFDDLKLEPSAYFVLTMHRPANVDDASLLNHFLVKIMEGAGEFPVVFPVHPRTARMIRSANMKLKGLHIVEPLSYLQFNYLVKNALGVITDSGGVTEETTVMNIPCITLRDSTERPETCSLGTNKLIGTNPENIPPYMDLMKAGKWKNGAIPQFWDGFVSKRIIEIIQNFN